MPSPPNLNPRRRLRLRKQLFVAAFLLPAVILFAVIYAYPLLNIFLLPSANGISKI